MVALETNRDLSVVFEIASTYCISDSLIDYGGYSISSKGFLPTVVDIMVWLGDSTLVFCIGLCSYSPVFVEKNILSTIELFWYWCWISVVIKLKIFFLILNFIDLNIQNYGNTTLLWCRSVVSFESKKCEPSDCFFQDCFSNSGPLTIRFLASDSPFMSYFCAVLLTFQVFFVWFNLKLLSWDLLKIFCSQIQSTPYSSLPSSPFFPPSFLVRSFP